MSVPRPHELIAIRPGKDSQRTLRIAMWRVLAQMRGERPQVPREPSGEPFGNAEQLRLEGMR